MLSFHSRPAEGEAKVKSSAPVDAATLIAEALKRKFAHRYRHDSEQGDAEEFKLPVPEVKPRTETPLVRDVAVFIAVMTPLCLVIISSTYSDQFESDRRDHYKFVSTVYSVLTDLI